MILLFFFKPEDVTNEMIHFTKVTGRRARKVEGGVFFVSIVALPPSSSSSSSSSARVLKICPRACWTSTIAALHALLLLHTHLPVSPAWPKHKRTCSANRPHRHTDNALCAPPASTTHVPLNTGWANEPTRWALISRRQQNVYAETNPSRQGF